LSHVQGEGAAFYYRFFRRAAVMTTAVFLCGGSREPQQKIKIYRRFYIMAFFNSAVDVLQMLVIAIGAGLAIWGVINLLEGYGQDNPASNGQYR